MGTWDLFGFCFLDLEISPLFEARPIAIGGLSEDYFDFSSVSAVVMDEFHSFADLERGIVWEISLSLLPPHVRLMLLSATVGNAAEFVNWLDRSHGRKVDLVAAFLAALEVGDTISRTRDRVR